MNPSRQVAGPLRTVAELRRIDRLAPLDGYQGEVLEAVRRSLASQTDVLEVTQAVARANDALTGRLLELAEEALGPPPCRYSWLALGSHGRGEQVLSSDQDSALAYDGAVERAAAEEYFPALAELVVKALARAGLPLCAGDFMATSWCRPIEEFASLFRGWVDRPEPEAGSRSIAPSLNGEAVATHEPTNRRRRRRRRHRGGDRSNPSPNPKHEDPQQ